MASPIKKVTLGVRAQRGGAVVVGLGLDKGAPRIVLSTFLPTAEEGDRLAFEPYHVAAEMPRGRDGGATREMKAAVADARKRQVALATVGLKDTLKTLAAGGHQVTRVALIVNRAGWMDDLLAYSLMDPGHPPVAEGLAMREALRAAFAKQGLPVNEVDEKSLPDLASQLLGKSAGAVDARMKELGASAGRPWRKEQKLACLAAWLTRHALSA